MSTFDDLVRSQALNRPIILYTITTLGQIFRLTTNAVDVTFGDNVFTAITVAHDDEQMSQDPAGDELVVHLPISHPVVQRYAATGIPDQGVFVTVQELQSVSSTAALSWSGPAQSLAVDGYMASLRIPSATADALKIQLPVITAQPTCNHVLFGRDCAPNPGGDWPDFVSGAGTGGPLRSDYQFDGTVDSVSSDGLTIVMRMSVLHDDGFFAFGKMFGTIFASDFTGEQQTRSIITDVGIGFGLTRVTLDVPFVGSGDQVRASIYTLEGGCSHDPSTCASPKFSNMANFGGLPQMNNQHNIWGPAGLGILQQI